MANLTTLRQNVSSALGLDNSASGDQTEIDARLNEGVVDMLVRCDLYVATSETTLTSGSADYELDTDILRVIDAFIVPSGSSERGRMVPMTMESILELRRASSLTALTGSNVYYALAGANLFMVYPTPTAADTVTFYFVPRPTAMTSGTNDPSSATYGGIPTEFHRGIELFALWHLSDYDDDQMAQNGEMYRNRYFEYLSMNVRASINRKHGSRMPRARVGRLAASFGRANDAY
jgi:hypothetical protein